MLSSLVLRTILYNFRNKKPKIEPINSKQFDSYMQNEKEVFKEYEGAVNNKTILQNFRQQVFKRQQISSQALSAEKLLDDQQRQLDKLLKQGSNKQLVSFSKRIMNRYLNNKKIFKDNCLTHTFSDYGDYSSYDGNYLQMQDTNLGQFQHLHKDTTSTNTYNFIDQLPNNYQEKQQIMDQIKQEHPHNWQQISVAQYGRQIQQSIQKSQYLTQLRNLKYDRLYYNKQKVNQQPQDYSSYQSLIHPKTLEPINIVTLSPEAINTIYDLYLEGWNVRDISRRFGILPKRTKVCIWSRAQLYNEVLPKLGLKYYILALENEKQHTSETGYVDYGLDLDEMRKQFLPDEITGWNNKMVDAQRSADQYTQALSKLEEQKKFNKYQMVQVGTHGKQNKMYALKQWKIFRGKGSDFYHLTNNSFRALSKAQRKMVKSYY